LVAVDASAIGTRRRTTMSLDGVVQKTALLLALVVAAGAVGWQLLPSNGTFPVWLLPTALVALGLALVTFYRPNIAPYAGPAYAVLQGLCAGAISAFYNVRFDGIVFQAIGLSLGIAVAF